LVSITISKIEGRCSNHLTLEKKKAKQQRKKDKESSKNKKKRAGDPIGNGGSL
jgi:hypothetical protein